MEVYNDPVRYHRSLTEHARDRRSGFQDRVAYALDHLGEDEEPPTWVDDGPACERCGRACGSDY